MYYEINVSKLNEKTLEYKHYFATAKRSLTSYDEAVIVLNHFVQLFPEPEYKISVSYNPETFTGYNVKSFLNMNKE